MLIFIAATMFCYDGYSTLRYCWITLLVKLQCAPPFWKHVGRGQNEATVKLVKVCVVRK